MTLDEWKALAIFGLGVYALSFFSTQAAVLLLVTVGIAAFVTRFAQRSGQQAAGSTPPAGAASGSRS
jgi:hypothetical protein